MLLRAYESSAFLTAENESGIVDSSFAPGFFAAPMISRSNLVAGGIRVLVVCRASETSVNKGEAKAVYINEQVSALAELGVSVRFSFVRTGGLKGYAAAILELRRRLKAEKFDILHAHYALSGLVARCQRKLPLVVTFHGSDVNQAWTRPVARAVAGLASWRVFVSNRLSARIGLSSTDARVTILPCGIDLETFKSQSRREARARLGLAADKDYVLFGGSFDQPVKNYQLARAAVARVGSVELIELRGYTREEVALLLNGVDVLLVTSITEGSGQIIKEAMACNCPIVCTDVADVRTLFAGVDGCYVVNSNAEAVAQGMMQALAFRRRTTARERVMELDRLKIAARLRMVYQQIMLRPPTNIAD